jgi:hypothetical protein
MFDPRKLRSHCLGGQGLPGGLTPGCLEGAGEARKLLA